MHWYQCMVRDVHQEVSLRKLFQSELVRHRHNNLFRHGALGYSSGQQSRRQQTLRAEGVIFPGKMMIPRFMLFSSKMLRSLCGLNGT